MCLIVHLIFGKLNVSLSPVYVVYSFKESSSEIEQVETVVSLFLHFFIRC